MTRFLSMIVLVVSGCIELKKSEEEFPIQNNTDWITYEGRVPINDKNNLYLEVSMLPGNPGEGYYQLEEFLETPFGTEKMGVFKGTYTTFSKPNGEMQVHFQNSAYPTGIRRSYPRPDGKLIREENYRVLDLVLKKDGDFKLIALDNSQDPITVEDNFNLSKRTSDVFTVEGTFAHVGDSSVFYEINTKKTWSVSRQGSYYVATRQYHELANKKNEGIYLKGTAFTIRQPDARGRGKERLVFKKIIAMTSSPVEE